MAAPVLIPLQGASAAIVIPLDATGTTLNDVHGTLDIMQFDNLGNGSKPLIPVPAGAAEAGTQPNIDWNRNDGMITRLKGENMIVDGETGDDITSEGTGGSPTHPTVTLVVNDIPLNRSDYPTYKAWLKVLPELYNVPCLIVIAMGKDYSGNVSNVGFFLMVGKLSSEIDGGVDGNTAKNQTLTFTGMSGVDFDSALVTILTGAGYLPTITPTQGAAVDFPNLVSGNLDSIETDEYVII